MRQDSLRTTSRRRLAGACVIFASALPTACSGGNEPARQEEVRTSHAAVTTTYDYVLADMTIDQNDATTRAGFNLDGTFSGKDGGDACEMRDYFSPMTDALHRAYCTADDPNCLGGVDNHLPEVVGVFDHTMRTSLRAQSRSWIRRGHAIWVVRVTDVDSTANDDVVRIFLYRGFASNTNCDDFLGGFGSVYVDNDSLTVSGDLSTPRWILEGSISNNRLYVSRALSFASSVNSPLPVRVDLSASASMTFDLYRASLYFDASSLSSGDGISAMFGGWVNTDWFSYRLEQAFPPLATQILYLMPQLSDLPSTSGTCDTGAIYAVGGISMGVSVTLKPVSILGAKSAHVGGCGSGW